MPTLKLDFLVVPTYNTLSLAVIDTSVYDTTPASPTIEITPPGFNPATIPFNVNEYNLFTSVNLGISTQPQPLPDGVYHIRYSITPAYQNYVEKSIMRTDKIQERFDEAFMHLDMMECDRAIKTQAKTDLNTIYFFIQGSIAAANNCAITNSNKLYQQADRLLTNFMKNNCGCSGNNYIN